MSTIDEVIQKSRESAPGTQKIRWNREMWATVWDGDDLPGQKVLDMIDTEVAEHQTIRRKWLKELADDEPIIFLAATTIWGYGNFGRGIHALRSMLAGRTGHPVCGTVKEIIEASRRSAGAGFSALFRNGRTRIPYLGIAFGTKVVHFAGYDHATPPPLILDKRVWRAAQTLDRTAPVPDPGRYTRGDQYQDYCEWAARVATKNSVTTEQVEYALFSYEKN